MVNLKYRGSIRKRLIGIILLVTSLTGLFGYGGFVYWYMGNQHEKALNLAHTVGLVLSQDIAKLVLLNEVSVAADISSQLKSFSTLKFMVLYKLDAKAIFQYSKDDKSFIVQPLPKNPNKRFIITDNILTLYVDAIYQDTKLGFVQLKFEIDTIWDVIKRDSKMLVLIFLLMLVLSYMLAIFYAKQFTNPILRLVSFLEKIEFVDSIKQRINTTQKNEYGKLYEEVNTMLDRMELSHQAQKISAVAFETQTGMTITDTNQKILQVNKAFTAITGYEASEAVGQTPAILKSGLQSEDFYKDMHLVLKKHHYWNGEIYNRHKDGTIFPEYLTIQTVLDEEDNIIYYVASFLDLTLQKESEAKLQYLKQYDALTGLANRELLVENIQQYLDSNEQDGWGVLLCFNLKDFKMINDAYGHISGDILLQKITKRLQKEFKDSSLISRIGADEFAIWFNYIHANKDEASIQSKILAEYLITILTQSFSVNNVTINTLLYVGISLYNEKDLDSHTLVKHAIVALHLAKEEDKNLAFFDEQAEQMALSHLDMYSQLLVAIELKQFELLYQLQYDDKNQIYGAEALIRWNHPKEGVISPVEFIPVAERTGLILPIGLWVVLTACKQLYLWQNDSLTSGWIVAINISAKQFNQEEFVEQIKEEIEKSGINPSKLKLELTESILVEDLSEVIKKMNLLQKLGIQISLDDFGTGYSSLQYLKNLPIQQVKIDQSFVFNMHSNKIDIAIIKSVLLLGEALNIEVIAEGVETKEHYELLKQLGCKLFQGYYFSRPQKTELLVS